MPHQTRERRHVQCDEAIDVAGSGRFELSRQPDARAIDQHIEVKAVSRQCNFEMGGGVSGGDVENDDGGIMPTGERNFLGRGREAGLSRATSATFARGRETVGERQAYPCRATGYYDGRRQAPNGLERGRRRCSRPPNPLIDD